MHPQVGGTYITTIHGKQWPIVICSDRTAPAQFVALRTNPEHMPAIQLGRHNVFVHERLLEDFNPHKVYIAGLSPFVENDIQTGDSVEVVEEKQRSTAFRQDAQEWKDDHFWANYITSQSEVRKLELESKKRYHGDQKRRSSHGNREVIDLESNAGRSQWSTPSPKRQKHNISTSSCQLPTPKQTPYKQLTQYSQYSVTGTIEISSDDESDDEPKSSARPKPLPTGLGLETAKTSGIQQSIEHVDVFARERRSTASSSARPGPHQCKLIFPDGKTLIVGKNVIANCQYLATRACEDESATELSLAKDKRAIAARLTASDITAVERHFRHGDLGPRFIHKPGEAAAYSKLDLMPKKKDAHAEVLSRAFVTAVKIEDETLQELIHEKLRTIYPLTPFGALVLARCVSSLPESTTTDVQSEVRTWATSHLSDCYWSLARDHVGMLQDLLEEDDAMRTAVYDALKYNARAGKMGFGDD